MKTNESAEDYLETILMLKQAHGLVRAIDIAHHMNFSKPSISRAMKLLREKGQVTVNREGYIELTEAGLAVASRICERHRLLAGWLRRLGVDEATASEEACRIEHNLSEDTFQKIKAHINACSGPEGEEAPPQ